MVVFVDLSRPSSPAPPASSSSSQDAVCTTAITTVTSPNHTHPFSRCLAVYPFQASLAAHLDHNDLYHLSSTCRQFHAELAPARHTLLSLSLRCSNDRPAATAAADITADATLSWRTIRGGSRCARDLVGHCLRCEAAVCRNCTQKPHPSFTGLRFRRLCTTCRHDPDLVVVVNESNIKNSGAGREDEGRACSCAEHAWFCAPCAKDLAAEDHSYRLWCEMWVQEFLPARRSHLHHYRNNLYLSGGYITDSQSGSSWGPVRCARGAECTAVTNYASAEDDGYTTTTTTTNNSNGGREGGVFEDSWEEMANAIETMEGANWEGVGLAARKPRGWRRRRHGGAEVCWEDGAGGGVGGGGWALGKEARGEWRAWCAWCDRVVLALREAGGDEGAEI